MVPATGTLRAMCGQPTPSRWQQRLGDELDDDGIELPGGPEFRRLLLEEVDHCRRAPVFEGRVPTYGAMILPEDGSKAKRQALHDHIGFDVVPLDDDPAAGRAYADGRSSYLVRDVDGGVALACFEQAMLYEADLVRIQEITGAAIVQRTPVLDVVRVVADSCVITWDGRHWRSRPTASSLRDTLLTTCPEVGERLVDIAELAIHWLAPSRIGATIVVPHGPLDFNALDLSTAAHTPTLSVSNRRHFSALAAVLRQHDLAVIADTDGLVRKVAVGLRWSSDAEAAIDNERGMRHRSAQRYSYDQHDVTVVVVSEDGPVTIYRQGRVVATTGPSVGRLSR